MVRRRDGLGVEVRIAEVLQHEGLDSEEQRVVEGFAARAARWGHARHERPGQRQGGRAEGEGRRAVDLVGDPSHLSRRGVVNSGASGLFSRCSSPGRTRSIGMPRASIGTLAVRVRVSLMRCRYGADGSVAHTIEGRTDTCRSRCVVDSRALERAGSA